MEIQSARIARRGEHRDTMPPDFRAPFSHGLRLGDWPGEHGMAGDWIKLEQATLQKAEVLRMAEMLDISRRECVGLLADFWAWLDNNATAESVPNLSRSCLDAVMHCAGFDAAMESVRWIKWDDKNAVAHIANYGHHNGKSAKSRALDQRNKKNYREICPDSVPMRKDKNGTREEKRRVRTKDTSANSAFAAFWSQYPNKKNKPEAFKAWTKLAPDEMLATRIYAAVDRAKRSVDWTRDAGQYVPHPASWLRGERWEDELTVKPKPAVESWRKGL